MITRDKNIVITHSFTEGHTVEMVVCARDKDGREIAIEASPKTVLTIAGKDTTPPSPSDLTATASFLHIFLTWTNPTSHDYDVTEVWRSSDNNRDNASRIATVRADFYMDEFDTAGLTRYYWIRAIDTSGNESYWNPDGTAEGVSATTVGIEATDIDDFAITATKIFTKAIILTGDSWTNNSPGAGSIEWNAHAVVYNGASYPIAAGNTADAYVYWTIGDATYSTSATHPALGTTAFMVAINTSGVHTLVWNSSANMVIGSAFIMNLDVDKLTANAGSVNEFVSNTAQIKNLIVTAGKIANATITNAKINDLNATKINAGDIAVARITAQAGNAVNAGAISISANKINIAGTTSFAAGYDPTTKVAETGGSYESAGAGARVLIFPDANTAMQIIDDAANNVFIAYVGGAGDPGVGDVIIGDYAGDNGVKYDKSAGTLSVRGSLNADDITAGTLSIGRLSTTGTWSRIGTLIIDGAGLAVVNAGGASFDGGVLVTGGGLGVTGGNIQCTNNNINVTGAHFTVGGTQVVTSQQAHIIDADADHDIEDPADGPGTADILRDDLVTNAIPDIKTNLNALGVKVNAILTMLETHGLVANA